MPDAETLKLLQAMPLDLKIKTTQTRLFEFYNHYCGQVYISFSGGKDSTVLLHIAREMFPDIKAVFSNTGLEYPEIQAFVRKQDNVDIIRPSICFTDVLTQYGYPVISKEVAETIYYARRIVKSKTSGKNVTNSTALHRRLNLRGLPSDTVRLQQKGEESTEIRHSLFDKQKWLPLCQKTDFKISHYCCQHIKKLPLKRYIRESKLEPILATMTEESRIRKQVWMRHGCNIYEGKPMSQPMSFWTEQDVLEYIDRHKLDIASVYGDLIKENCKYHLTGCQRTGCIFCAFGTHLDKDETRFQLLKRTHPKQYEYCMRGGQYIDNPEYDPEAPEVEPDGWINWNPRKIWVPSQQGLGMQYVFDSINQIYGDGTIRYK